MAASNINNSPSVLKNKYSRYVSGGTTDTNDIGIGFWERRSLGKNGSDTIYFVEKIYENRLDLIAAKFYGDVRYAQWIALYNDILDPYLEVVAGLRILLPEKTRIDSDFITG